MSMEKLILLGMGMPDMNVSASVAGLMEDPRFPGLVETIRREREDWILLGRDAGAEHVAYHSVRCMAAVAALDGLLEQLEGMERTEGTERT